MKERSAEKKVRIFIAYTREDEALLNILKMHLAPLQREGLINLWCDRDVSAGTEWEQIISEQLMAAQIVLLLVSPSFIASDYCYGTEMKQAIERYDRGEVRVIPIILRHVYWQGVLGKLQALPRDAKPVTSSNWHDLDEAFINVVDGIRKTVEELTANKSLIEFAIEHGDITTFNADVLALKYAQSLFGTDELIADLLNQAGIPIEALRPKVDGYCYVSTKKLH